MQKKNTEAKRHLVSDRSMAISLRDDHNDVNTYPCTTFFLTLSLINQDFQTRIFQRDEFCLTRDGDVVVCRRMGWFWVDTRMKITDKVVLACSHSCLFGTVSRTTATNEMCNLFLAGVKRKGDKNSVMTRTLWRTRHIKNLPVPTSSQRNASLLAPPAFNTNGYENVLNFSQK